MTRTQSIVLIYLGWLLSSASLLWGYANVILQEGNPIRETAWYGDASNMICLSMLSTLAVYYASWSQLKWLAKIFFIIYFSISLYVYIAFFRAWII